MIDWLINLQERERKARALETAEGIAEWNRVCEQTQGWMQDKFASLQQPFDATDMKAVQVSD